MAEKFNASLVDFVKESSLDAAGSEMVRQWQRGHRKPPIFD
jgi:hypothetical protein